MEEMPIMRKASAPAPKIRLEETSVDHVKSERLSYASMCDSKCYKESKFTGCAGQFCEPMECNKYQKGSLKYTGLTCIDTRVTGKLL